MPVSTKRTSVSCLCHQHALGTILVVVVWEAVAEVERAAIELKAAKSFPVVMTSSRVTAETEVAKAGADNGEKYAAKAASTVFESDPVGGVVTVRPCNLTVPGEGVFGNSGGDVHLLPTSVIRLITDVEVAAAKSAVYGRHEVAVNAADLDQICEGGRGGASSGDMA